MLLYDLHTHTNFSHGKGTPRENIEAALAIGLKKIGITDHGPGHISYGVRDIKGYFESLALLKEEYSGRIEVLSGLEYNLLGLNGGTDSSGELNSQLDIRLAGFHKLGVARDLGSFCYFAFTSKRDIAKNTAAYIKMMDKIAPDVITHPGYVLALDIKEFARACAAKGALIEINEKHHDLLPDELYSAAAEGAHFILSSDAHSPSAVGQVCKAYEAARSAGILGAVVNTGEIAL